MAQWELLKPVQPQEAYDKDLCGKKKCSDSEYQRIKGIIASLDLQNFQEVHDCYLWSDVLMLADSMERLSAQWISDHHIEPFYSYAIAGASYITMLWRVGPVFSLITLNHGGWEFMNLVNANILGGLSWAAMPYAKADPLRDLRLFYFDVNSLFPRAMCFALPTGGYRRRADLETVERVNQLIQAYSQDQAKGYMIECDFEVPKEWHDIVDFPPVCKMAVSADMLSPIQHDLYGLVNSERDAEYKKLIPFLGVCEKQARHVALLQEWTKNCHIKILKVHTVYEFDQAPVLRDFMEKLNHMKKYASSEVIRQVAKLIMNSLYGRFYLNKDKQCHTKVYSDHWGFRLRIDRDKVDWDILDMEPDQFLALVTVPPREIKIDTPRVVAWAILDLAKMYFYRFYYEALKNQRESCRMIYHDTDSVICEMKSEGSMQDFGKELRAWNDGPKAKIVGGFDLTGFDDTYEKNGDLGFVKSEVGDYEIDEVVCLASKMYAFKASKNGVTKEHTRSKGIPRGLAEQYRFDEYKEMLLNPREMKTGPFSQFRVHRLQSIRIETEKTALAPLNDKIFMWKTVHEDGSVTFHSRPLGHHLNAETLKEMNQVIPLPAA
jgi:hypothetical protein